MAVLYDAIVQQGEAQVGRGRAVSGAGPAENFDVRGVSGSRGDKQACLAGCWRCGEAMGASGGQGMVCCDGMVLALWCTVSVATVAWARQLRVVWCSSSGLACTGVISGAR